MTGRKIKDLLSYKKPGFWVTVVAIIIIAFTSIVLLSNPKDKETNTPEVSDRLTVEDYAKKFIEQEIEMYEDMEGAWQGFKIIDNKITRLEIIETFDNILEYPIEIWALEYRLKPDDISKVAIAGGMQVVDGWLSEDTSMGKPILVFTREEDRIKYLGAFYPSEAGIDTLVRKEIALRNMLETNGLIPNETYKGNHVVIQFTQSTGEPSKILLSQPIVQGDKGIWVVERLMSSSGYVDLIVPMTDLRIDEYYKGLQKQFENGIDLFLGDSIEVGYDFIINYLGQILVNKDDLIVIDPATLEDFMK